ncbi:MAG: hypothetical protein E6Q36_00060 [Chryseobacterium sp.]|nr:MAG: hypothetical protein E6Q36_00060 [Chryseobacterium sp.]
MATTVGESISRVRNLVKAVKEDAFMTDRFIYSLIIKYAKLLIRRQDNENKIMRFQSLFETIPCLELVEVDKVEACCTGIRSNCTIRRTKDKLPSVLEGSYGPLFRSVTSLDRSIELYKTYPSIYTSIVNSTNAKYNKQKYYWYLDGYLYFPNIEWDGILVEGLWSESVDYLKCDGDPCAPRQDHPVHIPEYLFAEVEQLVMKDLGMFIQMPNETLDDKQSPLRT